MATTGEDTFDRVSTIIAEITDIPKAELLPDKSLREDLEMDSLTTIELAVTKLGRGAVALGGVG